MGVMKNLLNILSLMLALSVSAYANNTNPTIGGDKLVVDNSEVSFIIKNYSSDFITTSFDTDKDYFKIETQTRINFLQVINADGKVEYQLPIGSNVLKLPLSDFDIGTFQINLLVEGENKFVSTELVIKN